MFSSRRWGVTSPESYRVLMEYGSSLSPSSPDAMRPTQSILASLDFDFNSDEAEDSVTHRFMNKIISLLHEKNEERLAVILNFHASSSPGQVQVQLKLEQRPPTLRSISFYRSSSTGNASEGLVASLLSHLDLSGVIKVKGAEGFGNFWSAPLSCPPPSSPPLGPPHQGISWSSLKTLNLAHCALSSLPPSIGEIKTLKIVRLSHNKLTSLPPSLSLLTQLEVLAADHNQISTIPPELKSCSRLREINFEENRIVTPLLDLRALLRLQSLQLFNNPLEFLPEMSHCIQLRSLSLANIRVLADASFSRWEVEVSALSYMAQALGSSRAHKLSPLFKLIFRRSSLQHPLMAGALGKISEDKVSCEAIGREEVAIQQVVLMAHSNNSIVVAQAAKIIGHLAASGSVLVQALMAHDVTNVVSSLVRAREAEAQLCGLTILTSIASSSDAASVKLLTPALLHRLHELILKSANPGVRQASLYSLSSLLFAKENKAKLLSMSKSGDHLPPGSSQIEPLSGLLPLLVDLAQMNSPRGTSELTRLMAVRTLAVLGENDKVRLALGSPGPIRNRGLRILSLDGGGMRGIGAVNLLRHLERRLCGRTIAQSFDLIVGTSTGAILACALGILKLSIDQCEDIYTKLSSKAFSNSATSSSSSSGDKKDQAGGGYWGVGELYKMVKSGSDQMRFALAMASASAKHDPATFEALVKELCSLGKMDCVSDQLIDASVLGGPKVAVVATLVSRQPCQPFVFRNYELPLEAERDAVRIGVGPGSSKHELWQAVRASSAAPYYLDDFSVGEERFQDGAATANNPTLIAIQQARLLWPHIPLECIVSVGSGLVPSRPRERFPHAHIDTIGVLAESATGTERVHEALSTLLPLLPDANYYRFQTVDERCIIELDDINPEHWAKLKEATEEYAAAHAARFDEAASVLNSHLHPPSPSKAHLRPLSDQSEGGGSVPVPDPDPDPLKLGTRKGVLLLEAPRSLVHTSIPTSSSPPGILLNERLSDLVSSLPSLIRRVDLSMPSSSLSAGPDSDAPALQPFPPPRPSPPPPPPHPHPRSRSPPLSSLPGHMSQLQTLPSFTFHHLPSSGSPSGSPSGVGLGGGRGSRGHHSRKSSLGSSNTMAPVATSPSLSQAPFTPPTSTPTLGMMPGADKALSPPTSSSILATTAPPPPPPSQWFFPIGSNIATSPPPPAIVGRGLSKTDGGTHPPDDTHPPNFTSLSLPNSPPSDPSTPSREALKGHEPLFPRRGEGVHVGQTSSVIPSQQTLPLVPRSLSMPNKVTTSPDDVSQGREADISKIQETDVSKGLTVTPPRPMSQVGPPQDAVLTSPTASSSSFLSFFIPTLPTMIWTSPVQSPSSSRPPISTSLASHPDESSLPGGASEGGSHPIGPASSSSFHTPKKHHQEHEEGHGGLKVRSKRRRQDVTLSPLTGLSSHQPLGGGAGAGAGAGAGGRPSPPHPLLQGLLQDLNERLGVVHLSLYPASHHLLPSQGSGSGLVTKWRREVTAVVSPGEEASRLAAELSKIQGLDLGEICRGRGVEMDHQSASGSSSLPVTFDINDVLLTQLALQEVHLPSKVSSHLMHLTRPSGLLLPEHLASMDRGDWEGLIVVSPGAVQRTMLEAFLTAGVRAIVAPVAGSGVDLGSDPNSNSVEGAKMTIRALSSNRLSSLCLNQEEEGGNGETADNLFDREGAASGALQANPNHLQGLGSQEVTASDDSVLAFFGAFYESLLRGETVISSMEAGESTSPDLEGCYACYHL